LLDTHKMDEKTWHLYSNNNEVLLGLSRPKNGILMLQKDEYKHLEIEDSPICCGYKNIFGHSNGSISTFKKGKVTNQKICDSAISAITIQNDKMLISNEAGQLYCNKKGNTIWEHYAEDVLSLLINVKSTDLELVFTSTRNDDGSTLFLLNSNDGTQILTSKSECSIRTSKGNGNMLLLGMDNGKIIIFEMDLLLRRFNQKNDSNEIDEGRKKMLDKLRNLRK